MRTLPALLAVAGVTVHALAQGTVNFNNDVWESTMPRRVIDMRFFELGWCWCPP